MSDHTPPFPMEGLPSSLVGRQLGSFLLTRQLGRGGMGAVYLGEHLQIGSRVAVKVLHPHLAVHRDLVARFYAEARAVNLIGHENIVSIYDMAVAPPSLYYYIMEYLEGQSLAELADGGPLSPQVAIPILAQVCAGLGAAHARGVIHRDLKPENIFLTRRGGQEHFVKVLDFGIAKLFASATDVQTRPGAIVGTPEYMAPEQAMGETVDGRIDLYALGVIAYRLATGRMPFTATSMPSLLIMHRDVVPEPPVQLRPSAGRAFSDVIMRALAKLPEERFQTAAEMREALEAALQAQAAAPAAHAEALARPPAPSPAPAPGATPPAAPARPLLRARVTAGAQGLPGSLECRDISRAGLFLCTSAPPPPLMARLTLMLEFEHEELPCSVEVVRHVSAEQAREWAMAPGFAVQLASPSPAVREALEAVRTGRPLQASDALPDDAEATALLRAWQGRSEEEPYALLGVEADVGFPELRQRGRELQRELEQLEGRRLSPRQTRQRTEALEKLARVLERMGTPQRRLEVDLARANFRGVARCLTAGLTVSELEAARVAFLARNPGAEARSRIHLATGQAWEGRGGHAAALAEYERGLAADPAHLELHQRYWQVRRRLEGTPQR